MRVSGQDKMKTLTVPDEFEDALYRILVLAEADAIAEWKRLNVLGSAYWDRPAGQGHDEQIKRVTKMRDISRNLLEQMQ
jgi:hypothetical protein